MNIPRQPLLFFLSIVLLLAFFALPVNRQWSAQVRYYWNGFRVQRKALNPEARLRSRFGIDYSYTKLIGEEIKKKGLQNELVLLPPTTYFQKRGLTYQVPVSPVFYYYTGIKTVWANNPHAAEANAYVRMSHGAIIIEKVTDRKALQDTIVAFQKLGVHL